MSTGGRFQGDNDERGTRRKEHDDEQRLEVKEAPEKVFWVEKVGGKGSHGAGGYIGEATRIDHVMSVEGSWVLLHDSALLGGSRPAIGSSRQRKMNTGESAV